MSKVEERHREPDESILEQKHRQQMRDLQRLNDKARGRTSETGETT